MKTLILGGAGFIGSHLAESFSSRNLDITVFDYKDAANLDYLKNKNIKITTGDFFNPNDLRAAIKNVDNVIHLISTTVPKTSSDHPIFDIKSNLIGTVQFLEIAKEQNVKVIFASSGGTIYGIPLKTPIPEDHPKNPISSYGISKLAIEKYLHLYHHIYGLDYCVLRMSNVYGERQSHNKSYGLIPTLIYNGLQDKETTIFGDGSIIRDYLYIDDAVEAFHAAITSKRNNRVFNIGSGKGFSINDIIEVIENLLGKQLIIKYDKNRKIDVPENILDNDLAKNILNWNANVELESGINKTVEYMKKSI